VTHGRRPRTARWAEPCGAAPTQPAEAMQHMSMRTHFGPHPIGDTLALGYAFVIVTSGL
jgi:hypothetical protein